MYIHMSIKANITRPNISSSQKALGSE